ncbi:MAG: DUF11 domain-containing protein, partial [Oscillospiraceae bacterium]|nr:DUF11 domain-containing protein [Oscillospiraceae bacterium]
MNNDLRRAFPNLTPEQIDTLTEILTSESARAPRASYNEGQLKSSKSANVPSAKPGDPVVYTVTLTNINSADTATGVVLSDTSKDIHPVPGTATLDGVSVPDDALTGKYDLGPFAPGQTKILQYTA